MEYRINTPQGHIEYTLLRKSMKNLRIRITGDAQVVVSAPLQAPLGRIEHFVRGNETFIAAKLKEVNAKRARYYPTTYTNGDMFWHVGIKTALHVCDSDETRAHLEDGTLTLYVPPSANYRYKKALFILWSMRTAKHEFEEHLRRQTAVAGARSHDIRISVKNMLGRWGSINTKRHTLSLSVHLLRCEPQLIDYVIMHELCHYAYANHSPAFYQVLERYYPDRKAIDKRLAAYGLVDF